MAATVDVTDAQLAQQKFMEEAAKRKRADGMAQFQELHFSSEDRLRHLVDDPFADHAALDKLPWPIKSGDRIKFLILGAGMGGILNAVRLIQHGFHAEQIRIVEVAGGIGGTWYWNRYPGLHCDVEAYVYLPMLEETGYMPSKKYASGKEIRSYLVNLVKQFGLEDRIMFRTQANGVQWSEELRAWRADLATRHGASGKEETQFSIDAEFVLLATGLFPRPQVPKLPGLTGFEGVMFHTARWNYDVTGGSSETEFPVMEKLKGKKVGVIGTGATAIQIIPEVAKYAEELFVFQRTPSQVNTRGQKDTNPEYWQKTIAAKKGWQKYRQENLAENIALGAPEDHENLVDDEWSKLKAYCAIVGSDQFGHVSPEKVPEHIETMLARDAEHNAKVRARVAEEVQDRETAAALTPWYPTWCKRPTFSDIYLDTYNKRHVHLINTNGKGVESATPNGIVANGREYPVDILIFSTGYRGPGVASGNPAARTGIEIVGRGTSMTEKWTSLGPSSLHGCATNGFPNLFWMGPSQCGATANFGHVLDVLSTHAAQIIKAGHDRVGGPQKSGVVIEVSEEAEQTWGMRVAQGAAFLGSVFVCTPGYLTNEGEALQMSQAPEEMMKSAKAGPWPDGMLRYIRELEEWRADGKLHGVEVSVA
ncbi:hypothetical protein BKA67DRAFT_518121 [Truncatella angustata]|uniref:FAD/NAD(P)-binding domain-containing protein n=1 Tax=Truncatella angustata TaxID=152316 RepID=A0A9P8ULR3_9PEZI|nr:uncharacterized protein BKA67DRAFT_518121 [Truncatella angustata]KAH6654508.1 hypothetical protein BKA67DRAFT_518121 [Truncatella angustata]